MITLTICSHDWKPHGNISRRLSMKQAMMNHKVDMDWPIQNIPFWQSYCWSHWSLVGPAQYTANILVPAIQEAVSTPQ